jgi:outer membrane translocation and assembly module TamA
VGPVALDYGFNLLRRSWEDRGAFHFSIGLFLPPGQAESL